VDEPTDDLDSTNGEALTELLSDLHRGGASICVVTHDTRYASYANRSIHLFDWRVVRQEKGRMMMEHAIVGRRA
jgi:putative ABC transport system ATP-binding protein